MLIMGRFTLSLMLIVVSSAGVLAWEDENVETTIKLYDSKSGLALRDCKKPEVNGYGIYFNLYTRERFLHNLTVDDIKDEKFSSYYDMNKVTKILVHGWNGYEKMVPFQKMVYDYLYTQDVNVISMDWSVYARRCSLESVFRDVTNVTGEELSLILNALVSSGYEAKKFHIIAFGVGSHIAGVAAKLMHHQIGRITALEPTGLRYDYPEYPKLGMEDAALVDVIYTTKGHSSNRDFGHIVFFPEGGQHPQPETEGEELSSAYKSISYFRRSILTPYAYPAKRIEADFSGFRPGPESAGSTYTPDNYMGEYVEPSKYGKYYVNVKGLPIHTSHYGANYE